MEFLESIKLDNGKVYNLGYHQERVCKTFATFFKNHTVLNLSSEIENLNLPKKGLYKIRIVYNEKIISKEVLPYQKKSITSFKFVFADDIDYSFKFLNRENLDFQKNENSEIIIVKNNHITDASFANLVFWDGKTWFTPETYLLNGTCRQRLLKENKIKATKITPQNIFDFKKIGLINALLDLGDVTLDISALQKP